MAGEIYWECFPFAGMNARKKQLVIRLTLDWNELLEFKDEEEEKGSPSWRVRVEYTDRTRQSMSCYDGKPKELYYRLLEYFETEEDWLTEELQMPEYSIIETAKENRKQVVGKALGNISAFCDGVWGVSEFLCKFFQKSHKSGVFKNFLQANSDTPCMPILWKSIRTQLTEK